VDFDPMPLVVKVMLVGRHPQHALQSLAPEFGDAGAAAAHQVGVLDPLANGLVPLEPFAEIVLPGEATADERVHRAIERSSPCP
jgi:hypothetical protein